MTTKTPGETQQSFVGIELLPGAEADAVVEAALELDQGAVVEHAPAVVIVSAPGRLEIDPALVREHLGRDDWAGPDIQVIMSSYWGFISQLDEERIIIEWLGSGTKDGVSLMSTKTILVCNNVDCDERGSANVLDRLYDAVEQSDLDVEVRDYLCFSACEKGPNVVLVEDRVWYAGVQPEDVDRIVREHIEGGQTVTDLTKNCDAITSNLIFTVLDAGIMPGTV